MDARLLGRARDLLACRLECRGNGFPQGRGGGRGPQRGRDREGRRGEKAGLWATKSGCLEATARACVGHQAPDPAVRGWEVGVGGGLKTHMKASNAMLRCRHDL